MSETAETVQTAPAEQVNAGAKPEANWDALNSDDLFKPETFEAPKAEPKAEEVNTDTETTEQKEAREKAETDKVANEAKTKEEADALAVKAKELGLDEKATKEQIEAAEKLKADAEPKPIEFTETDITAPVLEPEDGSFLALMKARGHEITKDTPDTWEEFEAKENAKWQGEIEKAKAITKDVVLADFTPEARAVVDLLNSGVTIEQIYEPVRMINELKKLDGPELVRRDLEGRVDAQGNREWTDDEIDKKIEMLAKDGNLDLVEKEIRLFLNKQESTIKQEHTQKLQQYQQQKTAALQHQKEQETAQFQKALNTVSEFMGGKVSDGLKQAILQKHNAGAYDNVLNSSEAKVKLLLYEELGAKAIKHIENTFFEKGRDTYAKKLSNVPPIQKESGGRVVPKDNQLGNWDAAINDFK